MSDRTVPLKAIHKTEGGTREVETKEFSLDRIIRTIVGFLVIMVDLVAFSISHIVIPLATKVAPSWAVSELAGHALLIGLGILLFNKETGLAVLDHILAKLPGGKK